MIGSLDLFLGVASRQAGALSVSITTRSASAIGRRLLECALNAAILSVSNESYVVRGSGGRRLLECALNAAKLSASVGSYAVRRSGGSARLSASTGLYAVRGSGGLGWRPVTIGFLANRAVWATWVIKHGRGERVPGLARGPFRRLCLCRAGFLNRSRQGKQCDPFQVVGKVVLKTRMEWSILVTNGATRPVVGDEDGRKFYQSLHLVLGQSALPVIMVEVLLQTVGAEVDYLWVFVASLTPSVCVFVIYPLSSRPIESFRLAAIVICTKIWLEIVHNMGST